ncbi:MAG: type II secretion system F family protein [Gammaproteobacteria bacterium]|nr:type II secretion system F family protein [Gammaproteobacteria bacterium]MCW8839810.1 type II secretion system F family protein [Gammaproteobacteria bacterium]MCW8927448.1 type II secretion system F family protein [Gammaproteobacteria bacterium]MCW8958152.1 type II secretion system F family protein [Gammaproteobacteria bacterium]MCW8973879.1 type II secretion system F family protein [Gammaproteobacteria bacterium]
MAQKAAKQAIFIWEGTDKRGSRKSGELQAGSMAMAKADLRRQGLNPLKVKKKAKPLFGSGGPKGKKITTKDIAIFARQVATMMSSGVPLVQSFEIMAKSVENPNMRNLINSVKGDIEGGSTLADAFRQHPRYFDDLTCSLVHAGEQAGILESLLDKIATYKEKTEALRSKIKKALFYPTAVIVVAFIITAILLIFVIPQFSQLFSGFGADLPALTKFVVQLSEFFQAYWYLVFGGLILVGYAFSQAKKRSRAFRDRIDHISLTLPIIGDILNKAAIARFARTLATMFAAGVPLVEAMESVAGAVGNAKYRDAVIQMRDDVSTGTSMTASMEQVAVFPNMVVQMASIGEEAGSLDKMLNKVADFYEQEVDDAVDALSSLLEPLIMAVLGVLVGGLVIAMYLPIFKMGSVVM